MHTIQLMEPLSEIGIHGQQFRKKLLVAVSSYGNVVEEVGSKATGTPEDPGFGCSPIEDRLPLGLQQREVVITEPIHVIQQNKTRDLTVMPSEESFDGIGLDGQSIESTVSQFFMVVRLQVLGTTRLRVSPGNVDAPEVIVLDWNIREDRVHGILDEFDDATGVLLIDLPALRPRHSEHTQGGVTIHGETYGSRPDLLFDLRVDRLLRSEIGRVEQFEDFVTASGDVVHIIGNHVSERAAGSSKVERFFGMIEEPDPAIPILAAGRGKGLTKLGCVNRFDAGQMAPAKHTEEIFVLKVSQRGDLQFQQSILPRVHVDRIHMPNAAQEVIQRIATGRCDDQEPILGC